MKLTPTTARSAPVGALLKDAEVPGLELRVTKTKRAWYFYHRGPDGQQRRPRLGDFPAMSLNAARAAAREVKQAVAAGRDPSAERQALRRAPRYRDLIDAYLADCARRVAPSTLENYMHYSEHWLRPAWGARRVADITRGDVDKLLVHIEKVSGPSEANHVRTQISMQFNRARDTFGMLPADAENPAARSRLAPELGRDRVASVDELRAIFRELAACRESQPAHVAAVMALFTCGARVGEIERAQVREWRGDRLVWDKHKTARRLRQRKTHYIHPSVATLIEALPTRHGRPSARLFGEIRLSGFWRKIRRRAGCPDLQLRDARRTFASYGVTDETSLSQMGQLLGHASTQTTLGYSWMLHDQRAKLTHAIGGKIMGAAGATPEPMRRRGFRRLKA